ncbi:MAG TPA: hypothetical protein PKK23_10620 [Nitrospirales bacterium]|nr:hypothetical protein [Nitrospirales bacterium]
MNLLKYQLGMAKTGVKRLIPKIEPRMQSEQIDPSLSGHVQHQADHNNVR